MKPLGSLSIREAFIVSSIRSAVFARCSRSNNLTGSYNNGTVLAVIEILWPRSPTSYILETRAIVLSNLHNSKEHTAIVVFSKECIKTRGRQLDTKTVFNFRYCIGSHDDFTSSLLFILWLKNSIKDGVELNLNGFETDDIQSVIEEFNNIKSMYRLDNGWLVRAVSDAEWKVVLARYNVTLDEEAVTELGIVTKQFFRTSDGYVRCVQICRVKLKVCQNILVGVFWYGVQEMFSL